MISAISSSTGFSGSSTVCSNLMMIWILSLNCWNVFDVTTNAISAPMRPVPTVMNPCNAGTSWPIMAITPWIMPPPAPSPMPCATSDGPKPKGRDGRGGTPVGGLPPGPGWPSKGIFVASSSNAEPTPSMTSVAPKIDSMNFCSAREARKAFSSFVFPGVAGGGVSDLPPAPVPPPAASARCFSASSAASMLFFRAAYRAIKFSINCSSDVDRPCPARSLICMPSFARASLSMASLLSFTVLVNSLYLLISLVSAGSTASVMFCTMALIEALNLSWASMNFSAFFAASSSKAMPSLRASSFRRFISTDPCCSI